jgi:hypothetical protein
MPGSTSRAMRIGAEHVGLELRPGQLVADVLDRAALREAGVVDDRPRPATGEGRDLGEAGLGGGDVVDLQLDGAHLHAALRSRRLHDRRLVGAAHRAEDVVARGGELEAGDQADAAVGTGDDDGLAGGRAHGFLLGLPLRGALQGTTVRRCVRG